MGDRVLECRGLTRSYGDRIAVSDVGFHIDAGETYALLGPNGSGKTTTISMLAGVLAADAGTVTIGGDLIDGSGGDPKRHVGLVPQEIAMYRDLSARENLKFFGRLQGMDERQLADRIERVLEIVGLTDRADDRVNDYSGGMQRRANIAAGMLHEPTVLILDEPTVGVDPQSRNQILESIETLGGEGLAVLYTTHYMEEAERLCDRAGILDGGVLIAEGTPAELVALIGEHDRIVVDAAGDLEAAARSIAEVRGVSSASVLDGAIHAEAEDGAAALAAVVGAAERHDLAITAVEVRRPDLETVFLSLTGRALRE